MLIHNAAFYTFFAQSEYILGRYIFVCAAKQILNKSGVRRLQKFNKFWLGVWTDIYTEDHTD